MTSDTPLWKPSDARVRSSQMNAFMQRMAEKHGFEPSWPALHAWSVSHGDRFWRAMFELAGIAATKPASATRVGQGMLGTKWFPGMELNFAAHLLRHDDDRLAIAAEDERGRQRTLTHRELRHEVARLAAVMRAIGVRRGDRVGGFMPNIPEALVAMLATASIGAIWSSCSPDFGASGVFDRFGQIEPKVLLAVDGYTYNGKPIDLRDRVREIVERIPAIERVVIVPFLEDAPDVGSIPKAVTIRDFAHSATPPGGRSAELTFEPVPFDHPLYIMYSSGTTGVPKCIVHGHGGTLLQHMKELMLHSDLRRDDVLFYFTTCGWMMWNWLVSGLGVGAAIVLYEGSPSQPGIDHLWRMAERLGVTHFGTSPRFIAACEKAGVKPAESCKLPKLRTVLSTGSPLTVDQFRWVYDHIKPDVQLASISGGTDIISCFMLGNPLLPVYAGEIQSLGLGMDVRVFDETARPVVGHKGELVCCSPFPSQPVGFWNDPDGSKYRRAYFDVYPGIWRHGDFAEITPHGGVIVYGRSDATLNPGGVRIGTAEIYRQIETLPEILDSVVVGKDTADADVEVCLFVVLRDGMKLDDALAAKIRKRISAGTTPRHVPKHIRQVTGIPYTISGKKVEIAVTRMINGQDVPNRDALANPEMLNQYLRIV